MPAILCFFACFRSQVVSVVREPLRHCYRGTDIVHVRDGPGLDHTSGVPHIGASPHYDGHRSVVPRSMGLQPLANVGPVDFEPL